MLKMPGYFQSPIRIRIRMCMCAVVYILYYIILFIYLDYLDIDSKSLKSLINKNDKHFKGVG